MLVEISDKIKNNIEEASNMSIVELAKFTGVSTSKITKYCKKMTLFLFFLIKAN